MSRTPEEYAPDAEYRNHILSIHFLILFWNAFDLDFSELFKKLFPLQGMVSNLAQTT